MAVLSATVLVSSCRQGVLDPHGPGVHLVFFLHITSASDQTNNLLALAFGIFVVALTVFGSMIIMTNLNHSMMPMRHGL
jgi:hypothetical protein